MTGGEAIACSSTSGESEVVTAGTVIFTFFFLLWVVLIAAIVLAKKDELSRCYHSNWREELRKHLTAITTAKTSKQRAL